MSVAGTIVKYSLTHSSTAGLYLLVPWCFPWSTDRPGGCYQSTAGWLPVGLQSWRYSTRFNGVGVAV